MAMGWGEDTDLKPGHEYYLRVSEGLHRVMG